MEFDYKSDPKLAQIRCRISFTDEEIKQIEELAKAIDAFIADYRPRVSIGVGLAALDAVAEVNKKDLAKGFRDEVLTACKEKENAVVN